MYRFTNGIVVFDEKTKDEYIKNGMKLEEDKKDKLENGSEHNKTEFIKKEYGRSSKKTSKHRK